LRVSQARNQFEEAESKVSYPENGDDMFLRNVGGLSLYYTALYPRR
jgi:hypothetical protein